MPNGIIGIIVHGGAGRFLEKEFALAQAACATAASLARGALQQGASALDAVEAAVRSLESDPILNAGRGSTVNSDGQIEMDALIQDGDTQRFGAVAGLQRVEHPVTLARWIMERTPHHFLIGQHAERFAQGQGMPLVDPQSLLTERQRQNDTGDTQDTQDTQDTVGAVALDVAGRIAVAVSTGGVRGKMPGRVGDTPIAGAGGYAESAMGGASATGLGEGIMRSLLTFRAVDLMRAMEAQPAADQALALFTERFAGLGGIIALDSQGRVGVAHNTPHMPCAWLAGSEIRVQIQQIQGNRLQRPER